MLRRHFTGALCSLAFAALAQGHPHRGPLCWLATRGKWRVFLMSFADARAGHDSWFTPVLSQAFHDSSALWLEVAPAEASAGRSPAIQEKEDAEYQALSHQPPGRTFFDELEPRAIQRVLSYLTELGITRESLEPLRPWAAYYKINAAYWARTHLPYEAANVDHLLWKWATEAGKTIGYEMPTGVAFARFMAAMPQRAQSQYIEFLLNYFDDRKRGPADDVFDWEVGSPKSSSRNLDRMRQELPELYQCMQVRRNIWWARRIDTLLNTRRTCYVAVGQLHALGPDGIPAQLRRLGIEPQSALICSLM